MKKMISLLMAAILTMGLVTGCGNGGNNTEEGFDASKDITVISREEGSGTRGAFIELFGVEEKDADGNKVDNTVVTADIQSSTGVVLTSVADNVYAIGYVSMGALNKEVKALKIEGVEPNVENVKNGTYKVARPFVIATKEGLSEVAQDFINFILSSEGQAVIEEEGYVSGVESPKAYSGTKVSGKVAISGSSSVTPVMQKLVEAYAEINPNAKIEVTQSDSSTGVADAAAGISEIGMASRELKDSELAEGLTGTVIAMDGIAVIVNTENPLNDITIEQVKNIYVGVTTAWEGIQ